MAGNQKQQGETIPPRSQWAAQGACSVESAPFMAEKEDFAACKEVCSHCPVAGWCLLYALANGEKYGVWGGLTPSERRKYTTTVDVSRVPLEFRDHYLQVEGRVKRNNPYSTPRYVRNPDLDIVIDPEFMALISSY